jgi:hypothetical protein
LVSPLLTSSFSSKTHERTLKYTDIQINGLICTQTHTYKCMDIPSFNVSIHIQQSACGLPSFSLSDSAILLTFSNFSLRSPCMFVDFHVCMYACMHVCMYSCMSWLFTIANSFNFLQIFFSQFLHVMYVCVYVCICVCVCMCYCFCFDFSISPVPSVSMYAILCVCVQASFCVCVQASLCVCVHVYACVHVFKYVCMWMVF